LHVNADDRSHQGYSRDRLTNLADDWGIIREITRLGVQRNDARAGQAITVKQKNGGYGQGK